MHGMILSHALSRPVQLISFAEQVDAVPGYKYGDYLASVQLEVKVISFTELLEPGKRANTITFQALQDTESVSAAIDELNSGLLRASLPLR